MAKILAIDDRNDNLIILRAIIKNDLPGSTLFTALNGTQGIKLAIAEDPDVILLDIVMPDMDGYEVCRLLKEDSHLSDIPVVFVTSLTVSREARIKALETGAEGFLTKPIDAIEMTALVGAMVKIKTANKIKLATQERLSTLVAERTRELEQSNKATLKLFDDLKEENEARKQTEAALRESEERFFQLFERAPLGYQSLDKDGKLIEVNEAWLDILGYTREEITGKWIGDLIAPGFLEVFREHFPVFLTQGKIKCEMDMLHKSGEHIAISFDGKVGVNKDGSFDKAHCILQNITERKKTEEQLRLSEEKYRRIFENVQDVYYETSVEGIILEISPSIQHLSKGQYQREDLIGKSMLDFYVYPEERQKLLTYLKEFGSASEFEITLRNKDGSLIPCSISAKFRMGRNGPDKIIGSIHNITKRKQAEEALRDSNTLYQSLVGHIPAGVFRKTKDGRFDYVNERFCELKGLTKEEILGKFPQELVQYVTDKKAAGKFTETPRQMVLMSLGEDHHNQILQSGNTIEVIEEFLQPDGSIEYSQVVKTPIYSSDGSIVGSQGMLFDITPHKRAEDALRESEALYASFVKHMPAGVFRKDGEGRFIFVNSVFCKLKGLKADEILGKTPQEISEYESMLESAGRPELINSRRTNVVQATEHHHQIMSTGNSIELEEFYILPNGTRQCLLVVKSPVFSSAGKVVGSQGIQFDITDHKRAEEQILLNTERLNRMLNIYQYPASSIQDFLDYALNEAIELTSSKLGYIYFYHEEDKKFTLNSWSKGVMKECSVANPPTFYELYKTGIWGEAVRQRKEIIVNNFKETHPLKKGYPKGHIALERFLTLPIFESHKIIAVVGVANKETEYDDSDVKQLGLMMNSVWRIAKRMEVEEQILKLNKAVEQSPVSIVITNIQGLIEYVNPKFTSITGYAFEEAVNQNSRFLQSGEMPKEEYKKLWDIILSGGEWHGEFHNKKKNGALYWEEAAISPIINTKGEMTHFLAVKEDISDKKRMIVELLVAKDKAEESDRLKTAFLHNISHEIRTPMNAIVGFAGLLNEPGISPDKQNEYTGIIVQSSNQLLSIISDIVHIATIEAGQEKMNETGINLNDLCDLIFEQFSLKTQDKDIKLQYHKGLPDAEANIQTDETKIIQVLSNLVNNALKFTRKGSVVFGYQMKGKEVEFYVEDTGIGIPAHMHQEIFNRFRQVENTATRQYGGSGLGLSISKAYVELLGGRIWLTSEPGQGSKFYFSIPFKKTPDKNLNKTRPVPEIKIEALRERTVLVAEDEEFNFMLLEEILSAEKLRLIRAVNGFEAVQLCQENLDIDVVLMDLKMPVMNGYDATVKIKELRPGLPVIAVTAYTSEVDKKRALACGCCDFISKPYNRTELIAKINSIFSGYPTTLSECLPTDRLEPDS